MAVILGKRKRRADNDSKREISQSPDDDTTNDLQAIFQKHFEAKFTPLKVIPLTKPAEAEPESEDEDEDASDWSGFSSEEEDAVEVVEHASISRSTSDLARKAALKKFMSSKPPQPETTSSLTAKTKTPKSGSDDETEASFLKKDAELQALLRESHLLDPSSKNSLNPTGKNRHKAIDIRLQNLGSKTSVFKEEKMPMAHRKGIEAKARETEDKRRKQAKENGIILERPQMKKAKGPVQRRERGVGGPAVGRFKGGTLVLTKNDVRGIVGSKGKGKTRGKRR